MIAYDIIMMTLVGLLLLAVLSIAYSSWRNGISPMPASAPVRRAVAAELNALYPDGKRLLVEAGSGWGTLAFHLDNLGRGWRIVGIENSPIPLAAARLLNRLRGSERRLSFQRGSIYSSAYDDADVIVCYLYPGAMRRLAELWSGSGCCRSGAYIISVCFALPGWQPVKELVCTDMYRTKVYVYRVA